MCTFIDHSSVCYYFMVSAFAFQENLLRTMMAIENTYFDLAQSCQKNCLVICDRGLMDASACMYNFYI